MARTSAPKTVVPKTVASKNIITLKVTLRGAKPPVWRRLVMPGTMTLADLHQAIQAAMGWHDSHLHAFDIGGEQYGDQHSVDDVYDENRVTLNGLLRSPVVRFTYTYDFGDNWEHTVAFEKSEAALERASYPVCITGKRNCPPEDCGGVWGYEELLAILADPTHPEHAERIDWLGEAFDPDKFDLERANTMLANRFRKNSRRPTSHPAAKPRDVSNYFRSSRLPLVIFTPPLCCIFHLCSVEIRRRPCL